ncbi:MAG: iron hydrogenase small subunit [Candidatus Omnitrophica bacterium]|nr:iron hydrogenase small subunit [Candidatus Omnitrophota bacterium]
MDKVKYVNIDGRDIPVEGEKNLLEVIRKAGIEIPTFCYVSELSTYGACRMCMVEVEGRGLQTSCSTLPEAGLKVKTNTAAVRQIRRVALELILANHERDCTSCVKSTKCKLQDLSRKLGVEQVRFRAVQKPRVVDEANPALVRNPNKCILCGDCVRMCGEVQGVGAIDFAYRGHEVVVQPAFGKNLYQVQCVYCGQCARVCPTGALTPKSETAAVWRALQDPARTVVVQIAPAVRVALGEAFGYQPGEVTTGKIVTALRMMGFSKVFDTCFAADLTVMEEGNEFIRRFKENRALPLFTSCCPAWVKYVEQFCPEMIGNLSTCKSPQQMFGAVAKGLFSREMGIRKEDMVVVSIMPCTAKKFEARRPEFRIDGAAEVDHVITTQELAQMINEHGIQFRDLQPGSLDLPLGFKTGAGVIFGASGGVMEAALRYVYEKVEGRTLESADIREVRGEAGIREAEIILGGQTFRFAVVHSLANARQVIAGIKSGERQYHFVEFMACPAGCINGAGQPVSLDQDYARSRTSGLYGADQMLQLRKVQDNPYLKELYAERLGEVGGERAHHLLHTGYTARRRMKGKSMVIVDGQAAGKLEIRVCVGTSCYLKGSQDILHHLAQYVLVKGLSDQVQVKATFCFEKCDKGPTIKVGDKVIGHCDVNKALAAVEQAVANGAGVTGRP